MRRALTSLVGVFSREKKIVSAKWSGGIPGSTLNRVFLNGATRISRFLRHTIRAAICINYLAKKETRKYPRAESIVEVSRRDAFKG